MSLQGPSLFSDHASEPGFNLQHYYHIKTNKREVLGKGIKWQKIRIKGKKMKDVIKKKKS